MGKVLHFILDITEIWAVLIPLAFYFYYRPRYVWVPPIRLFLFLALILGLIIDFIWFGNSEDWFAWDNNIYYNVISIVRLLTFSWFFSLISKDRFIYKLSVGLFLVIALVIFIFFVPPREFNSPLLALEAAILLFYCIRYFYFTLREDKGEMPTSNNEFWIVAGLCFYTAVNFFIFLFYHYLSKEYRGYAIGIWDVHNISFIIFCIFIARALKK
jgi:hypothetical protein